MPNPQHRLIDDTLIRDENGIAARCVCGWVSSGHFSSMGASVAFMQHRENPADGHEISNLARVQSLSNQIKPLLQGQGPEVQSAALADLVSLWLAGHPQEVREAVLALWLDTVRQLVPASVREVFGEHPPKGWETPQG